MIGLGDDVRGTEIACRCVFSIRLPSSVCGTVTGADVTAAMADLAASTAAALGDLLPSLERSRSGSTAS